MRPDSGDGKGKGLFATRNFAEGEVVFKEHPLVGIQHSANRRNAHVCSHCFRFTGSLEAAVTAQIQEGEGNCCSNLNCPHSASALQRVAEYPW